jgi:hypothetical protein
LLVSGRLNGSAGKAPWAQVGAGRGPPRSNRHPAARRSRV